MEFLEYFYLDRVQSRDWLAIVQTTVEIMFGILTLYSVYDKVTQEQVFGGAFWLMMFFILILASLVMQFTRITFLAGDFGGSDNLVNATGIANNVTCCGGQVEWKTGHDKTMIICFGLHYVFWSSVLAFWAFFKIKTICQKNPELSQGVQGTQIELDNLEETKRTADDVIQSD